MMDIYIKRYNAKGSDLVVGDNSMYIDLPSQWEIDKYLPILRKYRDKYNLDQYSIYILWEAVVTRRVAVFNSRQAHRVKLHKDVILINYYGLWLPIYKNHNEALMRIHAGTDGRVLA